MQQLYFENRTIYGMMWKNNVERVRAQIKIWRTRIATWQPKATNTHSESQYLLLFQNSNGWMNAPQCYVVRTLPILFRISFQELCILGVVTSVIVKPHKEFPCLVVWQPSMRPLFSLMSYSLDWWKTVVTGMFQRDYSC